MKLKVWFKKTKLEYKKVKFIEMKDGVLYLRYKEFTGLVKIAHLSKITKFKTYERG